MFKLVETGVLRVHSTCSLWVYTPPLGWNGYG
jgi:hypothetical protein